MAAAAHFSARIYGYVEGQPPFQNSDGTQAAITRFVDWPTSQIANLPTTGVNFWPLPAGYRVGNGAYIYSIIEIQPTGLNVHGFKYGTDLSVASLATLAG